MIDDKIDHLWDQGLAFDARVFTGLKRQFMRGFDIAALEGSTDDGSGGALEAARALFRWRDDVTETKETNKFGVGLLLWCALADITDAVRALIAAAGENVIDVVNKRLLIHRPDLFSFCQQGVTALQQSVPRTLKKQHCHLMGDRLGPITAQTEDRSRQAQHPNLLTTI